MIKEVVIPAAGLGTRFLPFTKSIPKEMLPIINKPAIEYIVQEAMCAGVKNFFIVSNKDKKAIEQYFKDSKDFNKKIDQQRLNLLSDLNNIINNSSFSYINQSEQKGLGHAVLMAKDFIKNDFFGVMLPDDLIFCSEMNALSQLLKIAQKELVSVIAVEQVPKEHVSSYGIIEIKEKINSNLFEISNLVEKPGVSNAPSDLAIIGRYVLSKKIFESIEAIQTNVQNEVQLTDAIAHMLKQGNKVYAFKVEGCRYDIGTPAGWLKANFELSKQIL